MGISIIKLLKSVIMNIDIKQYQLIYCTDTKECYYDVNNKDRIQIACSIQVDTEIDRKEITQPFRNKIYIVIESNKIYRVKDNKWIEVKTNEDILDIISAAQELIPTTMIKNGIRRAPKTIARNVYLNDGENIEEALKHLKDKSTKSIIFTRTEFVVASHDYQKIFDIPFPISNYDLKRFPIIAIAHGGVYGLDEYTLSTTQLILKDDELMKNEIMTFIFNYMVELDDNEINATTVNDVRIFTGTVEIQEKRESDVWIDTGNKIVKQYINNKWENIIDPIIKDKSIDESKLSQSLVDKINKINNTLNIISHKIQNGGGAFKQSNYILRCDSNIVPINLEFDKSKDAIFIFRNSIFMDASQYTIDIDSKNIICSNNDIWHGSERDILFNFIIFRGF